MCLDRSIRAKRTRFAILSGLNILILLALLAAIIVVWFAYGVAHTGKDATTDLMVLASTVTPAYVGVFLIWLLSRRFEKGLRRDGD
jgi:membrane protein implicated in regulation of membrane protease activity